MRTRQSLILGASIVLSCLILGLSFGRPSDAQQAGSPIPAAGRFQVVVKTEKGHTEVFVFEPSTGQCWYRSTNPNVHEWTDMGSPVVKKK